MIELAILILILALFISPLYTSTGCLGLYTTWFLYKSYESFKNQPLKGKKVLSAIRTSFIINFIASLILGAQLAWLIYFSIYDLFHLFIFNFIFCFLISIRWFDFSYRYFQQLIIGRFEKKTTADIFFVVCKAFKKNSSFGMSPIFTDAGFLKLKNNHAVFEGVFYTKTFKPEDILHIEKKSSENIKIYTRVTDTIQPHMFLVSLREQFYPFRSRGDRDRLFKILSSD
ncbi:MAG: hypothetical protein ACI9UO_002347 [Nitrospinales bacterium]|jgi:hypothetical protein